MRFSKMCNHCKLAGAFLIPLTCVSEFSPSCKRVNSVPVCSMNPSKPASDNWLSLKFKTCKMERWYISLVAHPTRLLLSSTMPVTRFPLSHVTLNQVPIEVLVFQLAFTVQCGPLETTKKHQNILFCICYSQGLSRMKKDDSWHWQEMNHDWMHILVCFCTICCMWWNWWNLFCKSPLLLFSSVSLTLPISPEPEGAINVMAWQVLLLFACCTWENSIKIA